MSDTPRSDSAEEEVNQHSAAQWGLGGWKMARTLERELAAKSAEVERLRALLVDADTVLQGNKQRINAQQGSPTDKVIRSINKLISSLQDSST